MKPRGGTARRNGLVVALLIVCLGLVAAPPAAIAQDGAPDAPAASVAQTPQPRIAAPDPVAPDARATLSRFGSFVQDATYGEVWIPTVTPQGWHPYPPCHWIKARQLGFYYDDPTDWGRIVHHYGRWTHDDRKGWMWVPGNAFSPAWVVWRSSPDWSGWAPLPPQPTEDAATADAMGGTDSWLFQETPILLAGCQADRLVPASEAAALIADVPYVRSFAAGSGIAVFGVPHWIAGPFIKVDVSFKPWPNWFLVAIVTQWNWVWHHTTTIHAANVCIRKL